MVQYALQLARRAAHRAEPARPAPAFQHTHPADDAQLQPVCRPAAEATNASAAGRQSLRLPPLVAGAAVSGPAPAFRTERAALPARGKWRRRGRALLAAAKTLPPPDMSWLPLLLGSRAVLCCAVPGAAFRFDLQPEWQVPGGAAVHGDAEVASGRPPGRVPEAGRHQGAAHVCGDGQHSVCVPDHGVFDARPHHHQEQQHTGGPADPPPLLQSGQPALRQLSSAAIATRCTPAPSCAKAAPAAATAPPRLHPPFATRLLLLRPSQRGGTVPTSLRLAHSPRSPAARPPDSGILPGRRDGGHGGGELLRPPLCVR